MTKGLNSLLRRYFSATFTIARQQKQSKCPSVDEWFYENVAHIHSEFYLTITKNEIIKFAGRWVKLENIMLCELAQYTEMQVPHVLSYLWILALNIWTQT